MNDSPKVRTCLWFDDRAEEAARFYVSLLDDSAIVNVARAGPEDRVLVVDFTLAGVPYQALNGGPHHPLSPAVSISILTEDQAETDRLWSALTADGGAGGRCAWLVDRFGLSWQIVPKVLLALLGSPDTDAAGRAMQAMSEMGKIDIAALEAAYRGDPAGPSPP